MLNFKDLHIEQSLYQGNFTTIYKSQDTKTENLFIVKTLHEDYAGESEIKHYENEFKLLQDIESPLIRKSIDLLNHGRTLVLEYIPFASLRKLLDEKGAVDIPTFLNLAILMSKAIAVIHQNRIIHKDINPNNFLVDLATPQVKLIDFGISTQLPRQVQQLSNPEQLEGSLLYISPEQTGRMNRAIDYRTDFYSLGITFYEMLTGKVPFVIEAPLQLIHAHIALSPASPTAQREEIPSMLSNIILKLLAKNAEDRYQSASGLISDLEHCQKSYLQTQTIDSFPLASQDISDRFQIPQKLYGREEELTTLLGAFDKMNEGENQLLLVTGHSGIGKSALIQELHKPLLEKQGYFVTGKFDQFKRNIPYSALVDAFRELIRQILTEKEINIQVWKKKLSKALGNNGQVIIDLIPDIELLMGTQPPLPTLGIMESQNRFKYTFEAFLKVFTQAEHPLTLFLDDLQWADLATLSMLEWITTSNSFPYLLIIGAYRDNEVDENHSLRSIIKNIQSNKQIHTLHLNPLKQKDITTLLIDTLNADAALLEPLVQLVHIKTQGNPFFVNEFLKTLYVEEAISFDYDKKEWTWDEAKINTLNITENVVELLLGKIQKLPASAQEILFLAACLGNSFTLNDLEAMVDYPKDALKDYLQIGLQEALIQLLGKRYYFVHDRIQQASYQLADEEKRMETHHKLFTYLQTNLSEEEKQDKIFEMVNHGNKAIKILTKQAEFAQELTTLNLAAGKRAKEASAFVPAITYLEISLSLLPKNSWKEQYKLTLDIHNQLSEAYWLGIKHDLLDQTLEIIFQNTENVWDQTDGYQLKILNALSRQDYKKAMVIGEKILSKLNVSIPTQASLSGLLLDIVKTKFSLRKGVPKESDVKLLKEEKYIKIMQIIADMLPAAYLIDSKLLVRFVLKIMRISLKKGYAAISAYAFMCYGFVLSMTFKDRKTALAFVNFSNKLFEMLPQNPSMRLKADFIYEIFLSHWYMPLKETIKRLEKSQLKAIELGDIEFVFHYADVKWNSLFHQASPLEELRKNLTLHRQSAITYNRDRSKALTELLLEVVKILSQETQEEIFLEDWAKEYQIFGLEDKNKIAYYALYKTILYYLFGNIEKAYESSKEAIKYIESIAGAPIEQIVYYYQSLIAAAVIRKEKTGTTSFYKILQRNRKQFKKWAEEAPFYLEHKYLLIEAEYQDLLGNIKEAFRLYNKAIEVASLNEYLNDEALAYELTAYALLRNYNEEVASMYFQKAINAYTRWGAHAKVAQMQANYPNLCRQNLSSQQINVHQTVNQPIAHTIKQTILTTSESLDLDTILKASQTLSGEVNLEKLLEKMLQLLLENAGAQNGFIIQPQEGQFFIEAEKTDEQQNTLQHIALEDKKFDLSTSVIEYVARTKQQIVLKDAMNDAQFAKDPYMQQTQAKSILCLPIIHQGNLLAILYLENRLSVGAFLPKQVELLTLLSSQIAISLENAMNYSHLERKVNERTIELKEKNERITDSIHYAKRIQTAILPTQELMQETFKDFFVVFKPKDIVSGDFYWLHKEDNKTYIAVVDCTGHGVPGAFMSMIAFSSLNELVSEKYIHTPAQILEALHVRILKDLNQIESQNRDGMDIALCLIENEDGNATKITFAGAKRPLYYIQDSELMELKGDRYSIGGGRADKLEFTNQTILLEKETTIYLTSDGLPDQASFNRSKYGSSHLKELLIANSHLPMVTQQEILLKDLQNHMLNTDQRDDITLLAIKI